VGIQKVDVAMETILHAQKARVVLAAREGMCGHDASVECIVSAAGGGLQALAARRCGRGLTHAAGHSVRLAHGGSSGFALDLR
jgi:hypothetical protein